MLRDFMGHSVKTTVEILAVPMWDLFVLTKFSWRLNIANALYSINIVENPHILPRFVTFLTT